MITVPLSTGSPEPTRPQAQLPDEPYLMMAAAQMHREGRLVHADEEMPSVPDQHELLKDIKRRGAEPPPPKPPETYWPSDGRRDKPSMMT